MEEILKCVFRISKKIITRLKYFSVNFGDELSVHVDIPVIERRNWGKLQSNSLME
jgi:hypothetical protein